MKKMLILVAVVCVAVVAIGFVKDMAIKAAVEKGVEIVTGLKLEIRSLHVSIVRQVVDIKDLKLHNPQGYDDRVMVDLPEVYVDYDLGAFFKGKVHLKEVRLDLREFVVVKNAKGELNLNALKMVQESKGAKKKEGEPAKMPELVIDELRLRIGKVVYKDYTRGTTPAVTEFALNLDETYRNVTNPAALASLIMVKALANTTIGQLANFDLGPLSKMSSGVLASTTQAASQAGAVATQVAGQAASAVTNTANQLKDVLRFPFGSGSDKK